VKGVRLARGLRPHVTGVGHDGIAQGRAAAERERERERERESERERVEGSV
jgi:hypothetical protein